MGCYKLITNNTFKLSGGITKGTIVKGFMRQR